MLNSTKQFSAHCMRREVGGQRPPLPAGRAGATSTVLALLIAWILLTLPAHAGEPRGTTLPGGVRMPTRAGTRYFEVRQADGSWQPLYVKGMNLSVALPGRFPSEIPYDEQLYRDWLVQIAAMNVNAIRVYTILTPEFYRAFRWYNTTHTARPLWLLHGIWAEAPPERNYLDAGYMDELRMEMRNAIDAVHGTAIIHPRPGHAEGKYEDDVSPWLLGWIVGREWETDDVEGFQAIHPEYTTYRGRYVSAFDVQPIEAWLASLCDYTVDYQQQRYRLQVPVTFSSWPPSDPMSHVSESNIEEETDTRLAADTLVDEFSNDAVNLSAKHFTAEAEFPAGIFASYHVYPYYPDFIDNDPQYQGGTDRFGPSTYAAYLQHLKGYYDDRPLLIAEYGLPNGPLPAHKQKQGWHHGGLTEAQVATEMQRLSYAIHDTGCAGGCVFAWIDEWFKKVWLWTDMYDPLDDIRLWFNLLDAEENYGMLALRPAKPASSPPVPTCTLSGNEAEWAGADRMYGSGVALVGRAGTPAGQDELYAEAGRSAGPTARDVRVMHDQGYVYVSIRLDNFADWDFARTALVLGLDVLDPERGNFSFPGPLRVKSNIGLENAIVLQDGRARLYQTESFRFWTPYKVAYQLQPRIAEARPYVLQAEDNPYKWTPPIVETNRRRVGRDGTVYPPQNAELNPLPGGSLAPGAADYNDNAMWRVTPESGMVELRLPWVMLGFVGPQQKRVLQSAPDGSNASETTDGIGLALILHDQAGTPLSAWPAVQPGRPTWVIASDAGRYTWDNWDIEALNWYVETKPVYYSLQALFETLAPAD